MLISEVADEQCVVLEPISWATYERLLREMEPHQPRMTYDHGSLEIMTRSFGHEFATEFLGRMVSILVLELGIRHCSGGSLTLKKKPKKKGLEADKCYWIRNASKMQGKKKFDIRKDPPPDLALEIDVTNSSLDRLSVYEALRVPEVWRYDGESILVYALNAKGKLILQQASASFPFLPIAEVLRFLKAAEVGSELEVAQEFTSWVKSVMLPRYLQWKASGNGKGPRK